MARDLRSKLLMVNLRRGDQPSTNGHRIWRSMHRGVDLSKGMPEDTMSLAEELRRLAAQAMPVEYAQGNYRIRVLPGVGRIPDVNFSIWEQSDATWEPIVAGWVRGDDLIVSSWRTPGSPANAESLARFILAGKQIQGAAPPHTTDVLPAAHSIVIPSPSRTLPEGSGGVRS